MMLVDHTRVFQHIETRQRGGGVEPHNTRETKSEISKKTCTYNTERYLKA